MSSRQDLRPAYVCEALLAALEAAEGRRRMRKRDQTPDAIGLAVKRALLQRVAADDPSPAQFEAWLLAHVDHCDGELDLAASSAMARAIYDEWRLAHAMPDFAAWLAAGSPSDDALAGARSPSGSESTLVSPLRDAMREE